MQEDPKEYAGPQPGRFFALGLVAAVIVIIALTAGIVIGHEVVISKQTSALGEAARQGINVLVAKAFQTPSSRKIEIPATIRGYVETALYAQVAGYLKQINVDKGDRIRRGELLAVLDTPDLDKQVADAKANYWLQAITDKRNQILVRSDVIPQQTADTSHSMMLQAKAVYQQLLAEQAYKRILAPFDGIVTTRYVDPGALIPQSTATIAATPILAVATLAPLRIYAYMPQSLALFVHNGDPAEITVYERPGEVFTGHVIRHPEALDAGSRTMLVEVDLPNTNLELYPGMYAQFTTTVAVGQTGTMVRDDSLVFREGKVFVPVVRSDHLRLIPVALGYDNGLMVQVNGDLHSDDLVALNVGQAAEDGELVHPVMASQTK
ncbi:MAG TPA: efflux RND transporter periplasmic adaptor subunit [Candidatus Binataceae bacterium]|nr:efflux RND transporter periplasmic adaptor subunit [Candidatus Binataceae bacterium]